MSFNAVLTELDHLALRLNYLFPANLNGILRKNLLQQHARNNTSDRQAVIHSRVVRVEFAVPFAGDAVAQPVDTIAGDAALLHHFGRHVRVYSL